MKSTFLLVVLPAEHSFFYSQAVWFIELIFKAQYILSLNNCINTAVAEIFLVSFGNNVDFIWQMTASTSLSK